MGAATIFREGDLAALSMAGAERSSAGLYTPDRVDLTLTGASQPTDLLVYVHETHPQPAPSSFVSASDVSVGESASAGRPSGPASGSPVRSRRADQRRPAAFPA